MVAFKTVVFSIFVPGTVGGLVPYLLMRGDPAAHWPSPWWMAALRAVPLALGAAGYVWCATDFVRRGRGTPAPIDPPQKLVTSGLYRFSRNPMYVSVILAIAGWAVLTGAWGLLWYAAAVLVTFQLFVVFYEEPKLAELFGDEYAAYRKRVRRWLG